jgi:hypothetical protein
MSNMIPKRSRFNIVLSSFLFISGVGFDLHHVI